MYPRDLKITAKTNSKNTGLELLLEIYYHEFPRFFFRNPSKTDSTETRSEATEFDEDSDEKFEKCTSEHTSIKRQSILQYSLPLELRATHKFPKNLHID